MKRKKFLSTLFASALAVSMLAGYGNVTTFASDDATATALQKQQTRLPIMRQMPNSL